MKQRFYGIRLLVTALAALTLSGPARAGEQVPFKGKQSGVMMQTGFSFPFVTTSVVGEGQATHVGRFTMIWQVVVDVITGYATGVATLTAANGDLLFLTMVGPPTTDPTRGAAEFTIVGGTGRFQGATGGYTEQIEFAFPFYVSPNTFTEVFEGTISSPGSNQ
jgi:hypothetical protein